MLEALIDPDNGNVIVAKPVGSIWGRCEVNAVVLIDDAELEARLSGKDHIVYPYAVYEDTIEPKSRQPAKRMTEQSSVKMKVSAAMKVISPVAGVLRATSAKRGETK